MARPRIFISSTFYDLKQIRSDIDFFIESLGYEAIRNEEGDIPYGKDEPLEEYCYNEIKSIDILISIIGGRYGTESKQRLASISQTELRKALKEKKQVYIFIEKNVLSEYETYQLNKENTAINYKYVDNIDIYKFIEEIKDLNINNNIKAFETANDITRYLKEQFAGLFQRFLEAQTKIKEASLIETLEKTSHNLTQLVEFLSKEHKGQKEDINRILMINHPLISELQKKLQIPYNIYIEGVDDLEELLSTRRFKPGIPTDNYLEWRRSRFLRDGEYERLRISQTIFDKSRKLKHFSQSMWKEEFVDLSYISTKEELDYPN